MNARNATALQFDQRELLEGIRRLDVGEPEGDGVNDRGGDRLRSRGPLLRADEVGAELPLVRASPGVRLAAAVEWPRLRSR